MNQSQLECIQKEQCYLSVFKILKIHNFPLEIYIQNSFIPKMIFYVFKSIRSILKARINKKTSKCIQTKFFVKLFYSIEIVCFSFRNM